ncbi:MAG: hypothetical protein RLZZ455_1208 [Candidatus Parcubacteria bacterium]|jgi:uncharacterized membrane protein
MSGNDLSIVLTWWLWILGITALFLPFTTHIFRTFSDRGYIFAKTIGIIFISYAMFLFGTLHILQFDRITLFVILSLPLVFYFWILTRKKGFKKNLFSYINELLRYKRIFFVEEMLFLFALLFLSYIRAFAPDIHGLEKYMDYGFMNSIGRATYFPPKDMWLPPESINYYYFGHLVTAVLTKLSSIPASYTYNLMLATVFGLCVVSSFSLGGNLFSYFKGDKTFFSKRGIATAILAALLLSLGGNLHTLYTTFKPYENEKPVPPWQLEFSPVTFPNAYWYPNATRFIHNTIHEFPIYSWTVSDLHGHVLDIPFVLLTLGVLLALFQLSHSPKPKVGHSSYFGLLKSPALMSFYVLTGFLLAIMYMTNAWDGIIYFLLSIFVILTAHAHNLSRKGLLLSPHNFLQIIKNNTGYMKTIFSAVLLVGGSYFLFVQPFNYFFKPFVSGVGVLCAPDFLTKIGKFGPLLFEANHCQHSPLWQLLILYGFFYFFVCSFLIFLFKCTRVKKSDYFVLILIFLASLLILIPEFIYAKDIYPAHYRANTMFKLVFQSFMLLSICSGYIIVRILGSVKENFQKFTTTIKVLLLLYGGVSLLLVFSVMTYPYMAINSYYGELKNYIGIDGTRYLKTSRPSDYLLISWLNAHIQGQPVILEAQGDSYTDYSRISSNTGIPTVLGWTVHEWLWRGSYDIPSPRIGDISLLYESNDLQITHDLLKKYKVEYVVIGDLEREKYPNLYEKKFSVLGSIVYERDGARLYRITQ